jgi:hypothetical protein
MKRGLTTKSLTLRILNCTNSSMKTILILTILSISSFAISAEVKSESRLSASKKESLKKELILKQIKMIKSSQTSISKKPKQA